MSYLKSLTNILLIVALSLVIVSCGDKDPAAPVGCCQVSSDACASPVSEQQCEEMNGQSFHEGGSCRTDSGECGVLQED